MPVEVKKYKCKFRCGASAIYDRSIMVYHEENTCYKNPVNKTCQTCKNETYEKESDDYYNVWHTRGCKLKEMDQFLCDAHESLLNRNSVRSHVRPLWHCPNHNADTIQDGTIEYIEKIKIGFEKEKAQELEKDNLPF